MNNDETLSLLFLLRECIEPDSEGQARARHFPTEKLVELRDAIDSLISDVRLQERLIDTHFRISHRDEVAS